MGIRINVVLVLSVSCAAVAVERNKIYMRKAEMKDQSAEASRYIYSADSQRPTRYVEFADTSGNLPRLSYSNVKGGRKEQITPLQGVTYIETPPQYVPSGSQDYSSSKYILSRKKPDKGTYGLDEKTLKYDYDPSKEKQGFLKKNGVKFDSSDYSSQDIEGRSGYKQTESFEKRSKGKYQKERHSDYYDDGESSKDGEFDTSEFNKSHKHNFHGERGSANGKLNNNKKGTETTGYNKIYFKDEYKKDHSFYDESDKRGRFNKYGNYDTHFSKKEDSYEKDARIDDGYQRYKKGKNGFEANGSESDHKDSLVESEGTHKYYKDFDDYENEKKKNEESFEETKN